MATYLMTFSFTQQGIQAPKDIPERVKAAKKIIQSLGGEVTSFYAALGAEYDTLFVLEAQDELAVGRMALAISALGNVRSSTHRLFSEDELAKIVAELP